MESAYGNESLGKKEGKRLDKKSNIHIHSRRKRLADPDGISAKAVIDGLVKAGVLPDDSSKFVKEISFSQEKADEDETIVTITEV